MALTLQRLVDFKAKTLALVTVQVSVVDEAYEIDPSPTPSDGVAERVAVEPNLSDPGAPESERVLVARLTVRVELTTVTDSYDVEFEIVGVGLIV